MADTIDIDHLATLSRLELTPEEKVKYAQQMGGVLEYAEKIGDFRSPEQSEGSLDFARDDTDKVNVGIINGVTDVMREDEVGASLPREEALKNAPAQKDGFIQVKGVFGEGE